MEQLFIYSALLLAACLLYKAFGTKSRASRAKKEEATSLNPRTAPVRNMPGKETNRGAMYAETEFPAELKERIGDEDFLSDYAGMDIPGNPGGIPIKVLPDEGIPELVAIGNYPADEIPDLYMVGPVLEPIKQEAAMKQEDLSEEEENTRTYRETFLARKLTGTRRQTYIHESLYETLARVLPVIAPDTSVPAFVSNVLAEHLEKHRDIIGEICSQKFKEMMAWKDSFICQ